MTMAGPGVVLQPSQDDLVDAGFVVLLGGLALLGFRTTYSGWTFLFVGVIGLLLGLFIAHLANALRQPVIVLAAMTLAAFFLLGGAVALRTSPNGSVLPTGATLHGLATESVHGWKDLLTTLPPVDGRGALLVLPYILGLFAGAGGFTLARRTRVSFAPAIALFAVLIMVILLGVHTPAARSLQGAVFGVATLGWLAVRSRRGRPVAQTGTGGLTRFTTAMALLAIAAGGSLAIGPHLPGASSRPRTVLRSYVHPPLDIGQYPSPLAAFRNYTSWRPNTLATKTLFTVSGNLPAGTPVRIATLDAYNGTVWAASNLPGGTNVQPDTFQKVGTSIENPTPGKHYTMNVTVTASGTGYWMPTAGVVTGVRFSGAHADDLAADLRYNVATNTGVIPERLAAGDRYSLAVTVPASSALQPADSLLVTTDPSDGAAAFVSTYAQQWSGKSGSQTQSVLDLASYLRTNGKYSDGGTGFEYYLPGHSQFRLKQFVSGVIPGVTLVGDDEQYAAIYALMIEDLGTPARVVLGAVPSAGLVRGSDVHAWVEVQRTDRTWAMIGTDSFVSHAAPVKQQQLQATQEAGQIVPPPTAGRPHSSLDDATQDNSNSTSVPQKKKGGTLFSTDHLPAWVLTVGKYVGGPLVFLLAVCSLIVAAKAARRRRRRRGGTPMTQLTKGWREVIDHARDLGAAIPLRRSTRREQGRGFEVQGVRELAALADAHVFGPETPTEQDAAAYWARVASARKQMSQAVGRWRRLRAAVSLASWRRPGAGATGRAT